MNETRFDAWTRRKAALGLGGLLAGALGLNTPVVAKKDKKKKKKDRRSFDCNDVGFPCGSGQGCSCLGTTEGSAVCQREVANPGACTESRDCPKGQVCNFVANVCQVACRTG